MCAYIIFIRILPYLQNIFLHIFQRIKATVNSTEFRNFYIFVTRAELQHSSDLKMATA
jgi:hypothetical protein